MSLEPTATRAHETQGGVLFLMKDGERDVVVSVTQEALQDVFSSPRAEGEYLEHFDSCRDIFESIAVEKYEANGCVGPIFIKSDDVVAIRHVGGTSSA